MQLRFNQEDHKRQRRKRETRHQSTRWQQHANRPGNLLRLASGESDDLFRDHVGLLHLRCFPRCWDEAKPERDIQVVGRHALGLHPKDWSSRSLSLLGLRGRLILLSIPGSLRLLCSGCSYRPVSLSARSATPGVPQQSSRSREAVLGQCWTSQPSFRAVALVAVARRERASGSTSRASSTDA